MTGATRISPARRVAFLALVGVSTLAAFAVGWRLVHGWRASEQAANAAAGEAAAARVAKALPRRSPGALAVDLANLPPPPEHIASHIGIDDGLRAQCMLGGDECAAIYGAPLVICRKPDCTMDPVVTTPQGFVGPAGRVVAERRPPGTFRVLALGGSTTGGAEWQCGWPGQLESLLRARAAEEGVALDFEVLNLGLPTAGSAEMTELYRVIGSRYESDVVIVGEEVNDLGNCAAVRTTRAPMTDYSQIDVLTAFLADGRGNEPLAGLSPWFARHLEDWRDVRRREVLSEAGEKARTLIAPRVTMPEGEDLREACRDARLPPMGDAPTMLGDYEDGWRYTRANLEELLGGIAEHDDLAVVLSTTPHAFEAWGCPTSGCLFVRDLEDWRAFIVRVHNPGMRAFAAERGVALADLEALFLDATPEELERLFNEWMHPDCTGYAVIAERYAELLWPQVLATAAP